MLRRVLLPTGIIVPEPDAVLRWILLPGWLQLAHCECVRARKVLPRRFNDREWGRPMPSWDVLNRWGNRFHMFGVPWRYMRVLCGWILLPWWLSILGWGRSVPSGGVLHRGCRFKRLHDLRW